MRLSAFFRRMVPLSITGALACVTALAQTAIPVSPARAALNKYCVTCHNERLRTAGLLLDKADVDHVSQNIALWEKVAHKLRVREMPPAGAPRPDATTYDSVASYLESELDRYAAAAPNPGRPVIHRLNRSEYTNAIRDLVALDVDTSTMLPADDAGYGFDNIGDVLTVSPMLIERYLSSASRISRLAVGDPTLSPQVTTYQIPHARVQQVRESDDLPFGSRGGVAIKHNFPLDAEYTIQVRLQRNKGDAIMGLTQERDLDVRIDDNRIKLFAIGGDAAKKKVAALEKYEETADQDLEVRFFAKAGPHVIGITFLKDTVLPEGILDKKENRAFFEGVGSVAVIGPYDAKGPGDTPSRRKIFVCHPATPKEEDPCARKIVGNLARAAYRRPITSEDMPTLLMPYKQAKSVGGFEAGVKMAVQRILVSPEFLFRIEEDSPGAVTGKAYRVSDRDMASRLSFFLWSTIPDDELLSLAEKGKLSDPEVLQQQVKRMLADPRSKTLVTNFVGQWLYLRNINRVLPDPVAFPDFDENLRSAFLQETQLFFQSMLQEDRSVVDLLRANYTFVNERLAKHYGIPGIHGSEFRRVTVTDESRQGLLGQGSLLTVTSYANRTSPTLRGKWVLENILGSPPPPPPPNVPSLKDDKGGRSLTMRQRMELHRQSPVCSSCHSRMDPLGFALENFDGLGRWRSESGYPSVKIDASGVLPDGTKFDGPSGLRQVLLSKQDQFVSTFTERLLTYALGRGVEPYDAPTIRKIVRDAKSTDYKWSAIITGIVNSEPFQMRRAK